VHRAHSGALREPALRTLATWSVMSMILALLVVKTRVVCWELHLNPLNAEVWERERGTERAASGCLFRLRVPFRVSTC